MTDTALTDTEEILVCRRRSFAKIIFSPFGILSLIFAVLTLGITMLVLVCMFFAMPRRIWISGPRLYADKKLPPQGVELSGIRLHLGCQTLFFFTINRFLRIYFPTPGGKERFLNINQIYYGKQQFNQAVALLGR